MIADCSKHNGHRRYLGGSMDGKVDHLIYADPSDYPLTIGTVLRSGGRSWYELDQDASEGAEAVYRFIGYGAEFPQRPVQPEEGHPT
jgi:hypothetical protein